MCQLMANCFGNMRTCIDLRVHYLEAAAADDLLPDGEQPLAQLWQLHIAVLHILRECIRPARQESFMKLRDELLEMDCEFQIGTEN